MQEKQKEMASNVSNPKKINGMVTGQTLFIATKLRELKESYGHPRLEVIVTQARNIFNYFSAIIIILTRVVFKNRILFFL